jgi:hypothetical protein
MRTLKLAIYVLVAVAMTACGGGGGGGGGGGTPMPQPLTATFTADAGCAGANELAMGPGTSAADMFDVEIRATGLTDFFGAGFTVTYDPATATFMGCDTAGSFLVGGGAPSTPCNGSGVSGAQFLAELEGGAQGAVNIAATLQGNVAGVTPTPGTDLLVTLTFRATSATSAANTFALTTPREVQTCAAPGAGCTMVPDGNVEWCGGSMTAM